MEATRAGRMGTFSTRTFMIWLTDMEQLFRQFKVKVLVAQSRPTSHALMDCTPLASCIHGILQVRLQKWVAIPFPGVFLAHGLNPNPVQADS